MRNYPKSYINTFLKPFGIMLARRLGSEPFNDIRILMSSFNVQFIIDAGAYQGSFSIDMAKIFPSAAIFAFEPHPSSYELLLKASKNCPAVKSYNVALGSSCGRLNLHINASQLTNSLAKASADGLRNFKEFVSPRGIEEVEVITLYAFMQKERVPFVDILKLDIQGYELEAIKGMQASLSDVKLIFLEIQFLQIYEGTPLFSEIETYLREHGFTFFQLYNLVRSPETGRLLYGDAIFINSKEFNI
jgi:FkbM family methyltransferase